MSMHRLLWCSALSVACLAISGVSRAQYGQPGGGFGGGGGEGPQKETPEGPAEQAPESEQQQAPDLTPPQWPGEPETEIKFFEMHGYFRFRGLLFHNPTLGLLHDGGSYVVDPPRPSFFPGLPLSERTGSGLTCVDRENDGASVECPANTLGSGNMRFRLEPTINVTEEVRIKSQIDILDNVVLGSTPEGLYFGKSGPDGSAPIVALSSGQAPVESGINSNQAAIRVKRVWGEVRTPLGELRFGRMPSHWGMGLMANNGDCLDCDYGDSVDRLMFASKLFDHMLVLGHDWAASGPTTATSTQAGLARGGGQPIDLEQLDDVGEFFFVVGKIDKKADIAERIDRGESVMNYGTYFKWRRQAFDWAYPVPALGEAPLETQFIKRGMWSVTPNGWVRLTTKRLDVELEGAYVYGEIDSVTELGGPTDVGFHIRQWGIAQRTTYRAFRNSLRVGLEVGAASGDEAEMRNLNSVNGGLNPQPASVGELSPAGADTISQFQFDPDYHVDMVFFREILGTVQNALYFRPYIEFDPIETFTLRLALLPSWALEPIATPGNKSWYGMEFDTGLFYQNEEHGFHAGLEWGVFFSAGALNSIDGAMTEFDGGIAQALRGTLAITY